MIGFALGLVVVVVGGGFLVLRRLSRADRFWLVVLAVLLALLFVFGYGTQGAAWIARLASVSSVSAASLSVGATDAMQVTGPPSLSASFVDAVLSASHSPAVGVGRAVYADSQQFGIDDAYALAFFLHESNMGRAGVAAVTHSWGNIICAGYRTCYGRFRSYASWQEGALDWFRLLAREYVARGLVTVPQIVAVYAPRSDSNDEAAYVRAVVSAVSAWRAGHVVA